MGGLGKDGKKIRVDNAVYITADWDKQGKLIQFSTPQKPKWHGEVGYIEIAGKSYTLPLTKTKYEAMQKQVAINNGYGVAKSAAKSRELAHMLGQSLADIPAFKKQVQDSLIIATADINKSQSQQNIVETKPVPRPTTEELKQEEKNFRSELIKAYNDFLEKGQKEEIPKKLLELMRGGAFPAMDLKDQSIIIAKTMKLADNPADRISIVKDLLKDSKHTELLKDIFSTEEQLRGDIVVGVAASGETELLNYFTQLMNKLQPVIPKEVEDRGVRDQSDPKSLTSPLTLAGHQKIPINSNQSIEITSPKSQQILSEKMLTSKNKKEDLEYPERFYSLPSFKSLEDASEQERKISENLPLNRTSSIQSRSRSNSSASIAEDFVGEESGSLSSSMVSLQNVDTEGISPELLIRRSASQTQIASENNDPLNKPRSQSVPNLKQLTDPNLPTELVKHTESSQDVSKIYMINYYNYFLLPKMIKRKKKSYKNF